MSNQEIQYHESRASEAPTKETRKNFSVDEDIQICRSYIFLCMNPITGTERKAKTYWSKIAEHFNASLCVEDYVCVRGADSLKTRWLNHIQPKTLKFAGCLQKTANRDSDSNDADDVLLAHRLYRQSNKDEKFIHMGCYEFLKDFEKWKPQLTKRPSEDVSGSSERPEGRKRAKASAKRNHANSFDDLDGFKSLLDQMKIAEAKSSARTDQILEMICEHMKHSRDLKLMMVDPSTILQNRRRLWIEKRQAEIFRRDCSE